MITRQVLVVDRLARRGETIAAAESLTGGLLTAALTDPPGASRVVRGGVVSYQTEIKTTLLGVDPGLLRHVGAVHPDVAEQMALGVRRVLSATWGVATTGVAGPDPLDGVPVGTVFIAVAGPAGPVIRQLALAGDRASVRRKTVAAVVDLVAELTE